MSLSITNNVASLTAQHNLAKTSASLNTSLERLSSGMKINRGADGPAALVISEQQRAQITGLQTAIANTSKAVSVVQTGEGALNEMNSLLGNIRGLAIDSANSGVNDANALAANQAEIKNSLDTIDNIANTTQFGTKKLLDGSSGITGAVSDPTKMTFLKATSDSTAGTFAVNVTTAAARATITAGTAQTSNLAQDENLNINGVQVQLKQGMSQGDVINAINNVSDQTGVQADNQGTGGATRLFSTQFGSNAKMTVQSDTAGAASSSGLGTSVQTAAGTDIAGTINGVAATGSGNVLTANSGVAKGVSVEAATSTTDATQSQTGALGSATVTDNSLVFQIGANANQTAKISLDKVNTTALGVGVAGNQFASLHDINVQTQSGAQDSIKVIDQAISDVSNLRGRIGAFQSNTLQANATNLNTELENTTAAESTVRDTDFAAETANYTKDQVLMQAGTTVLSNANQTSQLVLGLLK